MVSVRRSRMRSAVEARIVQPVAATVLASTVHEAEAMLVEAVRLWRRSPGGGRWPFAGDGPWHLTQREGERGDYDARGGDGEAPRPRPLPLSVREVARRDAVTAWLEMIPDDVDRRLVAAVVVQMERTGASQPDFMALRPWFPKRDGLIYGAEGLRMRYERVLGKLVRRLNGSAVLRFSPLDARQSAVGTASSGECHAERK